MNPESPVHCCAKRPARFRGTAITEIPELSPLVKPVKTEAGMQVHEYVCGGCGQQWEDHLVPFMHADVHVVVKAGVLPELTDPSENRPWMTPAPAPPPMSIDTRIMLACVAAAVVTGLATRPPITQGVALRQNWLPLFILGGVAAGLLLLALRRVLRKP